MRSLKKWVVVSVLTAIASVMVADTSEAAMRRGSRQYARLHPGSHKVVRYEATRTRTVSSPMAPWTFFGQSR